MTAKTTALVTGANKGLGREIARLLGAAGMTVFLGARDAVRGKAAAGELAAAGADIRYVQLDVTDESCISAAAQRVGEQHGRLDVLVNNAGILPEATADDIERPLDPRMFRETFETNVFGAVTVTKAFLPLLRRSDAGRIVNVSSTMGSLNEQGNPASPYYNLIVPAYQMSKAALNGLTIALAKSLTDTPIRVNSVCPGWVQTDLGGPDNRAAAPTTAGEAAQIVVDMAQISPDGPTGQFVDRSGSVPW